MPARINILGNPSDGNEGGFATISPAVDGYAGAEIEPADGLILECLYRASPPQVASFLAHACPVEDLPLPHMGEGVLVKGATNRRCAHQSLTINVGVA
jgi:hypothetical protein